MQIKANTIISAAAREAIGIVLLATVMALGINALRSEGIPFIASAASGAANPATQSIVDDTGIPPIDIETAVAYFKQGDALFIDARPSADYQQGHIQGALNLPDHTFDKWIGDFMENTPPEKRLITYCAGVNCHLSGGLAEKLHMAGYENATHLIDGWGQWQAAGMPTATGPAAN